MSTQQILHGNSLAVTLGAIVIVCCFVVCTNTAQPQPAAQTHQGKTKRLGTIAERNKKLKRLQQLRNDFNSESQYKLLVQPGTNQEAENYYTRISKPQFLNLKLKDSTLDSLLQYMGYAVSNGMNPPKYSGLTAKDLERIPSFVLMPRTDQEFAKLKNQVDDGAKFDELLDLVDFQNDRVLVSRFFAPKIATYYDPIDPSQPVDRDKIVPGWRKLVRLTARTNSRAESAGIRHLYLLFNVKEQNPEANPYENESANNQVILVPDDQDAKDSAYFLVYGKQSNNYPVINFLAADFDLPGHVGVTLPGANDGKYFVPRSCAHCHGHSGFFGKEFLIGRPIDAMGNPTNNFEEGRFQFAKPNYLDTDQWYDWMEFDFRSVTTSLNDVIFDGGKLHGSAEYERAMKVIQTLNSTIRDQTFAAEQQPGKKSYQTLAVETWLSLHQNDIHRMPYSHRAFGTERWDLTDKDEMRLVRLLDNHCFRCHSSLIYNVFDKSAVRERKPIIEHYLQDRVIDKNGNQMPGFRMPQGRVLTISERDEIIKLLNKVFP